MKCTAYLEVSEMKRCYHPNNDKRKQDRRADAEDSDKILPKRHSGERDGRGEANRGGNKSRHKPECRMINLREKMIFASGTRQRGAEFAITNRATKRRDSTDNPQHKQREPGLNVRQLKTKAGEDASANNVGDYDGGCR